MKFKIRHEQKWIIVTALISCLLMFVFGLFIAFGFPVWLLIADIAVLIMSMLLYFLEQIAGTVLLVDEDAVTIRYILHKRKIAVSEISDLHIEPYKRMRRRGGGAATREYRMRMTITLSDGKEIILTDKAANTGLTIGEPEKLSDSDVPLYKAYTAIQPLIP